MKTITDYDRDCLIEKIQAQHPEMEASKIENAINEVYATDETSWVTTSLPSDAVVVTPKNYIKLMEVLTDCYYTEHYAPKEIWKSKKDPCHLYTYILSDLEFRMARLEYHLKNKET